MSPAEMQQQPQQMVCQILLLSLGTTAVTDSFINNFASVMSFEKM
jgi:hypothetical protein